MIKYKRTQWYGIQYLFRLKGSLLPHCFPAMVMAGLIAYVFSSGILEDHLDIKTLDLFGDSYSMQVFGVVFGYLAVSRLAVPTQSQSHEDPIPVRPALRAPLRGRRTRACCRRSRTIGIGRASRT